MVESLRAQEDRVTAALDARIGLPLDSQFELRLPFVYLNQQVDRDISRTSSDESTSGLGDIRVGFAKTLVRENGAIPDIVGRIAWDTASGSDSGDTLDLTTGFQEFTGALSFVRRIDPLALTGGLSYQTTLERDDVKPGDVFGFNLGTTLAASPTTALSFGFSTAIRQDTEVNDVTIDGSNINEAYISFGISSVVRRNALLSLTFGTGLTDDSHRLLHLGVAADPLHRLVGGRRALERDQVIRADHSARSEIDHHIRTAVPIHVGLQRAVRKAELADAAGERIIPEEDELVVPRRAWPGVDLREVDPVRPRQIQDGVAGPSCRSAVGEGHEPEKVAASTSGQQVTAAAADQQVTPASPTQVVVARPAGEPIIPGRADEAIVPSRAVQDVVARITDQGVVAIEPLQAVVSAATFDPVVPDVAVELVREPIPDKADPRPRPPGRGPARCSGGGWDRRSRADSEAFRRRATAMYRWSRGRSPAGTCP